MYIQEVTISNIKSIESLSIKFEKGPGWHVIIGGNGAGKSSIIKAIAASLIGLDEFYGVKPNWNEWLRYGEFKGEIICQWNDTFSSVLVLKKEKNLSISASYNSSERDVFSAGFGPFRKFSGGNGESERLNQNQNFQRLASHLSLFGEDTSLTEVTKWLSNIKFQHLEGKISDNIMDNLYSFINSPDFLPNGTKLTEISSDGVLFEDQSGVKIKLEHLSDGFRSILSLTFELIRLLSLKYGINHIFNAKFEKSNAFQQQGIVLIDEIDAHLHPSWQTKIGDWFLKYFPNMQFIVTTHSPLVCRACANGSIHYIATPGSASSSHEIVGDDKDRLVKGNILEAYGTEMFGKDPVRIASADEEIVRLGRLNMIAALGKINKKEEEERQQLLRVHNSL